LYWTPNVDIELPPSSNAEYVYRLKILGWSYVKTEMVTTPWYKLAHDAQNGGRDVDAMGRSGCRAGPVPSDDMSDLDGCPYAYIDQGVPSTDNMVQIYWSVKKPLSMGGSVYTYQIPQLEPVHIITQVKYVVDVMHSNNPNGTPARAGTPQKLETTYKVNLVTPRSTR
jgi:hypothetical protein